VPGAFAAAQPAPCRSLYTAEQAGRGRFHAHDVRTGKVLWPARLGTSVQGFPISFSAGGHQHAVTTGAHENHETTKARKRILISCLSWFRGFVVAFWLRPDGDLVSW